MYTRPVACRLPPSISLLCLLGAAAGCSGSGHAAAGGGGGTSGPDPLFGTDGHGKGDVAQAPCDGVTNARGPVIDMAWPSPSNVGHDGAEGSSLHFHWSAGSHDVVQVASWKDFWHPDASTADPGFPRELSSGPKAASGDLYLDYGAFGCGYRPGIYFFVDSGNDQGGIVSAGMTVTPDPSSQTAAYYAPRPCSALSDPSVYGGRYAAYASRPGCTVFEVNNFQTAAHYDWMPPTFMKEQAKQGDLVLFRWTGFHNVVQVHDPSQDTLVSGGITSGPKKECVGGPHYSCANGPPIQGEYLIDTAGYRPGILHFSDESAIRDPSTQACWNPGCTGMNQQFQLGRAPAADPIKCCDLPGSSGKYSQKCRVVEVYNDGTGSQWSPYQIAAGGNDVVRFRWAGSIQLYQVDGNGQPKAGGFAMAASVECTPGPRMSCLEGSTAEFLFDVAAGLASGVYEKNGPNITWPVQAKGDGVTSSDSGAIIYPTSQTDPTDPKCP